MAKFGSKSKKKLLTVEIDLQVICWEVIRNFDFTVLFGARTPAFQFGLFKKGRKKINGVWRIVDRSKVVTFKDGYKKKSKHNEKPSLAVDLAPWPIDWKNINRFNYLAGLFMGAAERLNFERRIHSKIQWGGNWKTFKDWPHFQLKKN